jgi:hypothetical protein
MTRIAWITDVPGWAYDNRAVNLSQAMPGYDHLIVAYPNAGFEVCRSADIVVCPDPRVLGLLPNDMGRVVLNLNAVKIFEVKDDSTIERGKLGSPGKLVVGDCDQSIAGAPEG